MATTTLIYENFYNEDPALKDEELFQFYNKFDNVCDSKGQNDNVCNVDEEYTSVDPSVKDLYKKLACNLKVLKDNGSQYFDGMNTDNKKRCLYFRYWFYDRVVSKKYDSTKINKFFESWEKLGKEIGEQYKCNFFKMKKIDIYNIKQMYDAILLYGKKDKFEKLSKLKYCNNIKNYYIAYDFREGSCSENDNAFCNEIKEYIKEYADGNAPESLSCTTVNEVIELTEEERQRVEWVLRINPLRPKGQDEASSGMQGSSSHTVIGIFATAFGLFLLSLILYKVIKNSTKFTPFGPWINLRMKNYQRMWNKITGKNYGSLLDNSEWQQIESDHTRYNVAYHAE
ncbi:PIR Superfamily Protein [Plasmodium ovale wallikeri]|uniref:PIR Superfamily Protein n=1 Tax=Plasmodium ovale wallikeri TaxID=864142 RepID=A0A1A9AS32_PLAOA|nr:PIR Superfamily Protein [Plasmodium ovale wallikeri]SBT59032.1 PIR Superfamily Protein [Plasmodium ovale wallikeri]